MAAHPPSRGESRAFTKLQRTGPRLARVARHPKPRLPSPGGKGWVGGTWGGSGESPSGTRGRVGDVDSQGHSGTAAGPGLTQGTLVTYRGGSTPPPTPALAVTTLKSPEHRPRRDLSPGCQPAGSRSRPRAGATVAWPVASGGSPPASLGLWADCKAPPLGCRCSEGDVEGRQTGSAAQLCASPSCVDSRLWAGACASYL